MEEVGKGGLLKAEGRRQEAEGRKYGRGCNLLEQMWML
jgi:hypothetical protein